MIQKAVILSVIAVFSVLLLTSCNINVSLTPDTYGLSVTSYGPGYSSLNNVVPTNPWDVNFYANVASSGNTITGPLTVRVYSSLTPDDYSYSDILNDSTALEITGLIYSSFPSDTAENFSTGNINIYPYTDHAYKDNYFYIVAIMWDNSGYYSYSDDVAD